MSDLTDRLDACSRNAQVIGGCNTVPVPMFLLKQTIKAILALEKDKKKLSRGATQNIDMEWLEEDRL